MSEELVCCDAFAALPDDTAVVCHDAGAANVIIAGLKQLPQRTWRACMQGPAARAWEWAFGKMAPCQTTQAALAGARFLLSGTGWACELEYEARVLARQAGIKSVALLDHWVNYPQRFERQGKIVMPDEIWVTDDDALRLARECFPGQALRLVPNWYLKQQLALLAQSDKADRAEFLYLAEPARSNWGRGTPGEFQALDYFAGKLPLLDLPQDVYIRLRPHPSDPPGKYDFWMQDHPELPLELDNSSSMSIALGRAKWVAGCESYGLALALAAGCRVFCTLPPWAPPCRLPQAGLIHLATLDR
jgi:hypothetical protein